MSVRALAFVYALVFVVFWFALYALGYGPVSTQARLGVAVVVLPPWFFLLGVAAAEHFDDTFMR